MIPTKDTVSQISV